MGCSCNNNNSNTDCKTCNAYCDLCMPINSPSTQYFSNMYHNLENNYPVNRCLCSPFGINPRYYSPIHVPCDCTKRCYPC